MDKRISIRKFLLFNLLIAVITTIFITISGTYYFGHQEMSDGFDDLLREIGFILHTVIDFETTDTKAIAQLQTHINASSEHSAKFWEKVLDAKHIAKHPKKNRYLFQVWDGNKNQLLISSPHAPKTSLVGNPGIADKYIDGSLWRVLTLHDPDHGFIFAIGENYKSRNTMIRHLMIDDVYLILFIYPFSGLLVWLIVNYSLKNIAFFTNEVAKRAADRLDPVNLHAVPIEIIPLIDELNKLFLRLQQAFEKEQRFSADAAHELRTPLAALRTQAQVALKTTDPEERVVQLQQVIAGVDRCTHVVQQLLTLYRLNPDTITAEHFTNSDLAKIATEVIAQLAPHAIDKHIDIELTPDPECVIRGNSNGLYALIRNLVDNAIRYTPIGGVIKVFIHNTVDAIVLTVIDNGPGIPEALRQRALERFFRILGTQAQGSGLGLSIVEQIAKLHHGSVQLGTPTQGSGLEVTVTFPKTTVLSAQST